MPVRRNRFKDKDMTTENTIQPVPPLSHRGACNWLGVADQTLRNWRSKGYPHIPFIKVGRSVRYRLEDLQSFIEQNRMA
jgi:excisionase family DNA binding protein